MSCQRQQIGNALALAVRDFAERVFERFGGSGIAVVVERRVGQAPFAAIGLSGPSDRLRGGTWADDIPFVSEAALAPSGSGWLIAYRRSIGPPLC